MYKYIYYLNYLNFIIKYYKNLLNITFLNKKLLNFYL